MRILKEITNGPFSQGYGWQTVVLACTILLWCYPAPPQTIDPAEFKQQISVRISTDHRRFRPGETVRVRVEIWNHGNEDLFVFKNVDGSFSNAIAGIQLTMFQGAKVVGPTKAAASDSFASQRSSYPPLSSELARYWIPLPPDHFYGGEVALDPSWYERLLVPGRYRIQGHYSSRGFLARDINNPLLYYTPELKQLPYKAWEGEVETNSVSIEITHRP